MATHPQGTGDMVAQYCEPSVVSTGPNNENAFQYLSHIPGDVQAKAVADGSNLIDELNRLRDELQFVKRAVCEQINQILSERAN